MESSKMMVVTIVVMIILTAIDIAAHILIATSSNRKIKEEVLLLISGMGMFVMWLTYSMLENLIAIIIIIIYLAIIIPSRFIRVFKTLEEKEVYGNYRTITENIEMVLIFTMNTVNDIDLSDTCTKKLIEIENSLKKDEKQDHKQHDKLNSVLEKFLDMCQKYKEKAQSKTKISVDDMKHFKAATSIFENYIMEYDYDNELNNNYFENAVKELEMIVKS